MTMTINFSFGVGEQVRVKQANGAGSNKRTKGLTETGKVIRVVIEQDGDVYYEVERAFTECMEKSCMCTHVDEFPPEELEAVS